MIPAKNKYQDYYPALDAYDQKNDQVPLESYLSLLLLESLNKYITILNNSKIIPLVNWASNNKASPAAILNKAKRQTIPAFRQKGQ